MKREISEQYRRPIWIAVLASLPVACVDWGPLVIETLGALIVFWGSVLLVIWRRPRNPTRLDLILVCYGCIPFIAAFDTLICWVWRLKGISY
jgi:hypothetical protein